MRRTASRKCLLLLLLSLSCVSLIAAIYGHFGHIQLRLRQLHMHVPTSLSYRLLFPDGNVSSDSSSVCHTLRCIARYEALPNRRYRIPSIRHILWKSDRVSSYFARQLKTWRNIHPAWKYVLWRDSDLDAFVAKHYTGALEKFRRLPDRIMQVDMIRYMILHKFGGVYADLDYVLLRPLDRFQKFPAVVTRETEAHSLFHFGMSEWPPPVLANPAFLMSRPQHPFFLFCIRQLSVRKATSPLQFAGPFGLSELLTQYVQDFSANSSASDTVFIPPSNSFYPYMDNKLSTSSSRYRDNIINSLNSLCNSVRPNFQSANLSAYCRNVNVLDPITDSKEAAYAIHDSNKSRSSYDKAGSSEFFDRPVDIRAVLPNVVMADEMY